MTTERHVFPSLPALRTFAGGTGCRRGEAFCTHHSDRTLALSLSLGLPLCLSLFLCECAANTRLESILSFHRRGPHFSTDASIALSLSLCVSLTISLSHSLCLSLSLCAPDTRQGSSLLQTYMDTTLLHVCPLFHISGPHFCWVSLIAQLLPVSPRAYSTFFQSPMNC